MRLKNVPGSREKIAESKYVIQFKTEYETDMNKAAEQERGLKLSEYAGSWRSLFGNDHPLHIEIGMGKGLFLMRHAEAEPGINFVGIEKFSSVLVRALEKQEKAKFANVLLVRMDAESIDKVFAPGEVDKIYLNFSDPWPKERHAKRRLTSREFLSRYEHILADEGEIIFKTDNAALFDFSLEEIEAAGWELICKTRDLHGAAGTPYQEKNVMTEYEEKFVAKGSHICMFAARR